MRENLDWSPIVGSELTNWPKLALVQAHKQPWEDTRAAALYVLPHITDVWYAMMIDSKGETAWFTDQIPTCATDDKFMYINPNFYFKKTLEERVFIAAHEVLHAIFNHCGLMHYCKKQGCVSYPDGDVLPYIPTLMNIAMDCLINVILVKGNVGGKPDDCWYLPGIIDDDINAMEAYRILYKRWKKPGKKPCTGSPDGGKGDFEIPDDEMGQSFDVHLEPGTGRGISPEKAESERNPQEWDDAVNAAMQNAKNAGRLPDNLERIFKLQMDVPTPWQDLMAINVSSAIGREGHTWNYLDPEYMLRGIGFPGRLRHGCKLAVVVEDTSGSINPPTINMFNTNLQVILSQVKPKELIFGECDYTIKRWTVLQDIADLEGKVFGGGGTSVKPAFARVAEEGLVPDVLIYFTDLDIYDGYPDEPDYPVIWASTDPNKKAPWGTTIYVPPLKDNPETLDF